MGEIDCDEEERTFTVKAIPAVMPDDDLLRENISRSGMYPPLGTLRASRASDICSMGREWVVDWRGRTMTYLTGGVAEECVDSRGSSRGHDP